jgi:hypothetical protein
VTPAEATLRCFQHRSCRGSQHMPPDRRCRCRFCGAELPAWLPAAQAPDGAPPSAQSPAVPTSPDRVNHLRGADDALPPVHPLLPA